MQIGSEIPAVPVQQMIDGEIENIDLKALSTGRKIVVVGVPGAFTPPCGEHHVPGYLASVEAFKGKGVDEVVVLAPNDFFVMKAWADAICPDGSVRFVADGSQRFTQAAGQELDLQDMGLGLRTQRYAAVVSDGQIQQWFVEPVATEITVTGADAVLAQL